MTKYVSEADLTTALRKVHGTSHHLLKIWFVLKQMGLAPEHRVSITTMNSTDALNRLFSFGDPNGRFFIPFAHTERFQTMMHDASRSIIQTSIQRWYASGSVVEVDPTSYLHIEKENDGALTVSLSNNYPQGLGFGPNGFALEENARVAIPDVSFAIWYYRQTGLDLESFEPQDIVKQMQNDLGLSHAEMAAVFIKDDYSPTLNDTPLSDEQIYQIVIRSQQAGNNQSNIILEDYTTYMNQIGNLTTINTKPAWLNTDPEQRMKELLDSGTKNLLLYGPPRTGKTHLINSIIPRDNSITIQMHDGWTYEDLVIGLTPLNGEWEYRRGPLLEAILSDKKYIVLEEINRTDFVQAIGDLFSLIEEGYRNGNTTVTLKDGTSLTIPEDKVFVYTMNTLDRSVTIIDDALFGRVAAIEFPPRVEQLETILNSRHIDDETRTKLRELFNFINTYYPLGHAFFADYQAGTSFFNYYATRIRPVLQKHLENLRQEELSAIDEKVDQLFSE